MNILRDTKIGVILDHNNGPYCVSVRVLSLGIVIGRNSSIASTYFYELNGNLTHNYYITAATVEEANNHGAFYRSGRIFSKFHSYGVVLKLQQILKNRGNQIKTIGVRKKLFQLVYHERLGSTHEDATTSPKNTHSSSYSINISFPQINFWER
jgi:hypothetical protein